MDIKNTFLLFIFIAAAIALGLAGCNSSPQVGITFVSTLQGYLEECG